MKKEPFSPFDTVVIGSGAAGLTAALGLAAHQKVCVLQKESAQHGATPYAQGGIAAVLDSEDSTEKHVADTTQAGAFLCESEAVYFAASKGPDAVKWLIDLGVPFTRAGEQFHLTQEGGHSHRRIIHADDATGSAVHKVLLEKAQTHPNITLMQKCLAFDLEKDPNDPKRVVGVRVLNEVNQQVEVLLCHAVIIATGGASHVYQYSTNPGHATGDGMAIAAKAGCSLMNLEFNQFHPTTLFHQKARSYLLTEAIRGEGGVLKNIHGKRFMEGVHPQLELAPRDIVARAIHLEIKKTQHPCVYLDISHKDPKFVQKHFPTIYETLLNCDLDLTREAIPVVPAAHYTCGGIRVDLDGRTDLVNVYAIGEVACTGLHGANRMASNSLLECLVFAKAASEAILKSVPPDFGEICVQNEKQSDLQDEDLPFLNALKSRVQSVMWNEVGIVRNNAGLSLAVLALENELAAIADYHKHHIRSARSIEVENLSLVSLLMAKSAMERKESRGLHFNEDHPELGEVKFHSVVTLKGMRAEYDEVALKL